MKAKDGNATQALKEEAEHATNKESQEKSQEDDHGIHGNEATSPLLTRESELIIDILEEEIHRDLNDPVFQVLMEDSEFQSMLDAICGRMVYKSSSVYSWEDLKHDVLIKFGRWLWRYRYQASLKTVLWKIARNHLIDVHRRPDEQCCSLEELLPEEYDVEVDLPARHAVADIQDNVQVNEWLGALKEKERELFIKHHLEGRSLTEVADERGVTRQAVDKQWQRVLKKLAPLVSDGKKRFCSRPPV